MSTLQNKLEALASAFARDVLAVLRGVSIDDIATISARGGRSAAAAATSSTSSAAPKATRGRPRNGGRRSAADIDTVVDRIVELLGQHADGMRSEQIQSELGLSRREVPRPLKAGLHAGRIEKRGQRRATMYFAAGSGGAAATGGAKRGRRPAGRRKKAA